MKNNPLQGIDEFKPFETIMTSEGGVYKNKDGKEFIVSTKCAHLVCQLHWNADELTWDCPCHGSRFTYDGKSIYAPSIKNLQSY